MNQVAELLRDILIKPRFAFAVWVTGVIVTFSSKTFGFSDAIKQFADTIMIVTAFALTLWLAEVILLVFNTFVIKIVDNWIRLRRATNYLVTLHSGERQILEAALKAKCQTIAVGQHDPDWNGCLIFKGLIEAVPASLSAAENKQKVYVIPFSVWKLLQKRGEEFGIALPKSA